MGQIGRRAHLRIGGNENPRRSDRVQVGIQFGVAARGCDVHRPVAGAADVGLAALLDTLESAPAGLVVVLALGRADQFAEFVVQSGIAKIALLLRNPFLKPEMRLDDEPGHGDPPLSPGLAVIIDAKVSPEQDLRHAKREWWIWT